MSTSSAGKAGAEQASGGLPGRGDPAESWEGKEALSGQRGGDPPLGTDGKAGGQGMAPSEGPGAQGVEHRSPRGSGHSTALAGDNAWTGPLGGQR